MIFDQLIEYSMRNIFLTIFSILFSATKRLRQRWKHETKSNVNKDMRTYLLYLNEFRWWEDNKEMAIINWGALYYTFETSGKNFKVAQHFRASLDEKTNKKNCWKKNASRFLKETDRLFYKLIYWNKVCIFHKSYTLLFPQLYKK